jgi:hypothetical protein
MLKKVMEFALHLYPYMYYSVERLITFKCILDLQDSKLLIYLQDFAVKLSFLIFIRKGLKVWFFTYSS